VVLLCKRGSKLERHAVLPVSFNPMTGKAEGEPEGRSPKTKGTPMSNPKRTQR
jgi:hypothetical protein